MLDISGYNPALISAYLSRSPTEALPLLDDDGLELAH